MPDVILQHPSIGKTLTIETGANQITWSYGLNTQAIPTYGGEVVQILSAYIDDLTIEGEVGTYAKMESIYAWFLNYMQIASQPTDPGKPGFNQSPCVMSYPERGWQLQLQPKGLPAFRYATDAVAPTWQIQAQVVEDDPNMAALTMEQAIVNGFDFGKIHAGIGYDAENPFTDPAASADQYNPQETVSGLADFYGNLISAYNSGDFSPLLQGFYGSKPAGTTSTDGVHSKTTNNQNRNKQQTEANVQKSNFNHNNG
jgi:hypothetical protein